MGFVKTVYSRQEALDCLGQNSYIPLAAGTDIFPALHQNPASYPYLLDISAVPQWQGWHREEGLRLGALCTMRELESLAFEGAKALVQAAGQMGSPQIRNRATVGGNLQTASPAGDMAVALLGLDAQLWLAEAQGSRKLLLAEFFTGVRETVKKPTELIEYIGLQPKWKYSRFYKLGQRNALAIATASLAFAWDGRAFRVALGSVNKTPALATKAMQVLGSGPLNEERIRQAKAALQEDISPISDVRATAEYRRRAAAQLLEDALADFIREVAP